MLGGGENSRHLANKNEPSVCGGDAAFYRVTLTTCFLWRRMGPTDIGGPGSQLTMAHIL